jgi:hypothetical protein
MTELVILIHTEDLGAILLKWHTQANTTGFPQCRDTVHISPKLLNGSKHTTRYQLNNTTRNYTKETTSSQDQNSARIPNLE